MASEERIWLGRGRVFMTGDAAGLVDLARGMGMDAAALSGRLAARAIGASIAEGKPASDLYSLLMRRLVTRTRKNQGNTVLSVGTNAELQAHLDKGMLRMGADMFAQNLINKVRSGEQQVMLP